MVIYINISYSDGNICGSLYLYLGTSTQPTRNSTDHVMIKSLRQLIYCKPILDGNILIINVHTHANKIYNELPDEINQSWPNKTYPNM